MGILGEIKSKQKHFSVGGREVLCIDADFPAGNSPAATHMLHLVEGLCAYAERELLKDAADALMAAVGMGRGHRFTKRFYRIAVHEAREGKRHRVSLTACFFFLDVYSCERIERFRQLETLWDAEGVLQVEKKWGKAEKNRKKKSDRQHAVS